MACILFVQFKALIGPTTVIIKMTAGSIAVPTVIPLRPPIPGRPKSAIDSNTKIELRTGILIFTTPSIYLPNAWQ